METRRQATGPRRSRADPHPQPGYPHPLPENLPCSPDRTAVTGPTAGPSAAPI